MELEHGKQNVAMRLRHVVLALLLTHVVRAAATVQDAAPRALGAACECRCCWDIGGGREECSLHHYEFVLRPTQCGALCTDAECAARFRGACREPRSTLHSTCRRAAPRALALLCFMGAALALLFFAFVRQPPQPFVDGVNDELTRRDSDIRERPEYGALLASSPRLSQDLPFLIRKPPEADISLEKTVSRA